LPRSELSPLAEADFKDIGAYTLRTWGETQADRYLTALEDSWERVAENPFLGRACDHIRPGLRRIEQGSHVIFYEPQPAGILVVRILHRSMLPEWNPMGGESV
jgi:toxin ParE1/3/4